MSRFPTKLWVRVLWWSSVCWAVVLICADATDRSLQGLFLNSDQMYIPALVEDLLRWSGSLADWSLTPSPYFFPDVLVYGLVREFGASIEWASYIAGIIQFVAITLAARSLLVRGLRWSEPLANLIAPLFPLLVLLRPHLSFVKSLFLISNHGSAAWMSLVTLGLCLRAREAKPHYWTALSVALAMVFAFSDPLYAISCSAPLAVLALYELARGRSARATARAPSLLAGRALCSAAGACAGVVMLLDIPTSAASSQATRVQLDRVDAMLDLLIRDALGPAFNDLILSALIALVAITTLVALRGRPEDAPLRMFARWCLLSLVATVGAMLGSDHYVDIESLRYLVVPWAAGAILIAAALLRWARSWNPAASQVRWIQTGALATLAGLMLTLVTTGPSIAQGQHQATVREQADCVQEVARREGSSFVLAEYWNAKPLLMFSGDRLRVVQVDLDPVRPRLWINSKAWYRELLPLRWSVLVANGFPQEQLMRYGPPSTLDYCTGLAVYSYRGNARRRIANEFKSHAREFVEH